MGNKKVKETLKQIKENRFKGNKINLNSCEVNDKELSELLEAIKNSDMVSPSAFQNSVYNTAASYHSIVQGNTSEILTLSCGNETSYNVMQQAALSLLKEDEVFVCVVEAMNFDGVDSLNKCANELEYGISFMLKQSEKEANIIVENKIQKGVPASLSWMKNLYDLCENKDSCIVAIEL